MKKTLIAFSWSWSLGLALVLWNSLLFGVAKETLNKGHWTWVGGSKLGNAKSTTNITGHQYPGALYGAATWTDANSNVWMFGGSGQSKPLHELWVFNAQTKKWSLVDTVLEDKNASRPQACVHCAACSYKEKAVLFGGVIKRKGKSEAHTWILDMKIKTWTMLKRRNPPLRVKLSYWCDQKEGDLWTFGGDDGTKIVDDMWHFSFKHLTWTQIDFSKMSAFPEARFSSTTWYHSSKLYLFGGQGDMGLMSDLWVFSSKAPSWKKLIGSGNASEAGIYDDRGILTPTSRPGCRRDAASWTDGDGNLWMFGGSGCDNKTGSDPGLLSDLWLYNTTNSLWAWVGGLTINEGSPSYGKRGQTSATNLPGPRESAIHFNMNGNLWLFGGSGHDGKGADGLLNDLWLFGLNAIAPPPTLGPATHGKGLPGDTLAMPYSQRIIIALVILTVVMIVSLLLCYRKECNIWCWRYRNRAPKVRYEPIKVRMQVPDV